MTAWDVLDKTINNFSPIAITLLLIAAIVIFIVGFTRRRLNFIKYGFGRIGLDENLEKRFDKLEAKIEAIETNHFDHLKDFLTELTGILVDKNILNNNDKARLDNHLRGM